MVDFGERIKSIKGARDTCTITFSNGSVLVCHGELLADGFCISKGSLDLSPEAIDRLQEMIKQKSAMMKNPMKITIE